MKKLLCCAISLVATSVSMAQPPPGPPTFDVNVTNDETSPVPINAQTITEYRVVGFTDPTDGSIEIVALSLTGVAAMHALCAEVAPHARAAFSDEALRSPVVAGAPPKAWVIPAQKIIVFTPDSTTVFDWIAADTASGQVGTADQEPSGAALRLDCGGYRNSAVGLGGLALETASGAIQTELCTGLRPIACSAPVAIPISP